ncbi:MAG: YcjF family protein [Bacteroidales bacterium]|nr:YcjF family protein [Bacteroidales bacterium]
MKPFVKHLLLIALLLAVYFAADFLEKGIILNDMTPFPFVGVAFWGLLLYIVWVVLIRPIIQFRKLQTAHGKNITETATKIRKQLEAHKLKKREDCWQSEIWHQLNDEINMKCSKKSPEYAEREKRLASIIDDYIRRENETSDKLTKAKSIINKYSWSAALCVMFSRNSFLDGLLMLLAQMKMTVELAELYGYKPSPLFNSLCFGWIATNSILTGLFAQAGSEAVSEILTDSLTNGDVIEGGLTNTVLSKVSSIALEGLTSATTVYVTGHVVLMRLQGINEINIKTLFKLRREGRLDLIKAIPQNTFQALSAKLPDFASWWQKVKESVTTQKEPLPA